MIGEPLATEEHGGFMKVRNEEQIFALEQSGESPLEK